MVSEQTEPNDLEGILDELASASDGSGPVSVSELLDTIGQRSFGPFLLVPALIAFTPLGGIPGLPTALAVVVILIASQLLIGMKRFWLPSMILERSIERQRLRTSIGYLRPVARAVDKVIRPRLRRLPTWLRSGPTSPQASCPRTAWQRAQPLLANAAAPRVSASVRGSSAGLRCRSAHSWNSSGRTAMT